MVTSASCLPSLPPALCLYKQTTCADGPVSWHNLPQRGASLWRVAQTQARLGDKQGRDAGSGRGKLSSPDHKSHIPDCEPSEPPSLCQTQAPSPHTPRLLPSTPLLGKQVAGLNGLGERGSGHSDGSLFSQLAQVGGMGDEEATGSPPEPQTAPGHQGLTCTPHMPRLPFSAHAE